MFPYIYMIYYALFNSRRNLSAIIAMNSLFVGLPFVADTVYPNIFSTSSAFPLFSNLLSYVTIFRKGNKDIINFFYINTEKGAIFITFLPGCIKTVIK